MCFSVLNNRHFATGIQEELKKSEKITVRKEQQFSGPVSGKDEWVQYLKIILTPETADFELNAEATLLTLTPTLPHP